MKYLLFFLAGTMFFVRPAQAAIQASPVEYKDGDTVLEGFLAYDDAIEGKRPGIIVIHEWKGLGPHAENSAKKLAELGYTALAVDMYGKGIRPQTNEEAGKEAGKYKNDRPLMRKRVQAGLDFLKAQPSVDPTQLAAIGYCFGGTTVLEMARANMENVKAVVSFHGGLSTPNADETGDIQPKVLVLHGADDPNVPPPEVNAFKAEMKNRNADLQFIPYEGAVHSFTNPDAGNDPSKGAAYNKKAAEESWVAMKKFLGGVFNK